MKRTIHSIEDSWKGIYRDQNKDASLIVSTDQYQLNIVFDGVSSVDHAVDGIHLLTKLVKENHEAYYNGQTYDLRSLLMDMNGILLKSRWTDMQTTICALYLPTDFEEPAIISHLGDSRIYVFNESIAKCITEDHNVPQLPNMLTRCLGLKSLTDSDFYETKIQPQGDQLFLLCTDGLYSIFEDQLLSIAAKFNAHNANEIRGNIKEFILNKNSDDATYILIYISADN